MKLSKTRIFVQDSSKTNRMYDIIRINLSNCFGDLSIWGPINCCVMMTFWCSWRKSIHKTVHYTPVAYFTMEVNSSTPGQNGRQFTEDIFKCICLNENVSILIQISLRFIPKGPVDNKWALVQVVAWRQTGAKPLPEPMLTQFIDVYMGH